MSVDSAMRPVLKFRFYGTTVKGEHLAICRDAMLSASPYRKYPGLTPIIAIAKDSPEPTRQGEQ